MVCFRKKDKTHVFCPPKLAILNKHTSYLSSFPHKYACVLSIINWSYKIHSKTKKISNTSQR